MILTVLDCILRTVGRKELDSIARVAIFGINPTFT